MKSFSKFTVFCSAMALGASILLSGCTSAKGPDPKSLEVKKEALISEAKELHKNFVEAFNAADAKKLASLYASDAQTVLMPPDEMVVQGGKAIAANMEALVSEMAGAQMTMTEEHFLVLNGIVTSWGFWEMSVPAPKGKMLTLKGRFTEVLAKENGKLVVVMEHSSLPMHTGVGKPVRKVVSKASSVAGKPTKKKH